MLQDQPLQASDKYSFNLIAINCEEDWQKLITKTMVEAETFAIQIEQLNESKLFEGFADATHSNFYRNLVGIIEHTHYHLGQISLIKKILAKTSITLEE